MPPASGAWPRQTAYFWEQAPFFRLLLPFVAGILLYQAGTANIPAFFAPIALGGCVACFVCWLAGERWRHNQRWLLWLRFLSFNLFFLLAAWLVCFYQDSRNAANWYGYQAADTTFMVARVMAPPKESPKTQKLELALLARVSQDKKLQPVSGKGFLYVFKKEGAPFYQRGDTVLFPARWQPVTNSSNPFAFDYVAFSNRKGYYHQTFAGPEEVVALGSPTITRTSLLWRMNDAAAAQLRRYLPDKAAFGLLQAMLLGNEQDFDPQLRQAYADTGVVHIVSISGSHTAMLFLVVTWLFFWLRKPRWQWVKYAVGVALVWLYVLVAGAPPSALRSAVMFTLFALSFMTEREQQPLNTLLMAAFVLLLANPMFLFAIGFQLSFTAVLSLILFYQPIYRLWPQSYWLPRKLWQLTAGSLAVEVLIAPLVAYYFHNFPVLVLFANIAAMLLLGIIALVGGLAILAFCWWPWLAAFVGKIVTFFILLFNGIVIKMQGWSPAATKQLVLTLPELMLLYGVILFLAVFLLKKKKPALFVGLSLSVVLGFLLLRDQYVTASQQRLIAYQVSHRALIDVLNGQRYLSVGKDTAAWDHRVTITARTGFSAWRPAKQALPNAFLFRNKKVVVWEDRFLPAPVGGVDVLLLTDSLKHFTLSGLKTTFAPGQIVVTGPQSRWLSRKWADSARQQGVAFHSVLLDGAFVLE